MRISSITTSILLLIFLFYLLSWISLGGINAVTLPWMVIWTIFLVIALVMALYGRYLLPVLLHKLGVKFYIGDGYIDGNYFIATNYDAEGAYRYAGFSVIKLIPTTPSVDLRDEDKKLLLRNVESMILSLPSDVEFGIMKTTDPHIKKLLQKIENEISKYYARKAASKNPGSSSRYDRKIAELEKERERILSSNPVTGIIYIKVYSKARTVEELKENLKKLIDQAASLAHTIQCNYKVLSGFDLYDFIEAEGVSRVIRQIE